MKTLLFTGATGALAPFLIHHLMHEDRSIDRFACLVRGADAPERLQRRVAAICSSCGHYVTTPRFAFVMGDIKHGIPYDGPVDAVWHFASDLRMDPSVAEEVSATNLLGTRTILKYCERTGAILYYISTAYVCGTRNGTIREEELLCGQGFRNAYEASKAHAESLVQDWLRYHPGIVFRPSIVLGDTRMGIALGFHGMYKILWALWRLRKRLMLDGGDTEQTKDQVLTLAMTLACSSRHTPVNVVAAEYVTSLLAQLHRQPQALGKTFHLVNPMPPTAQELLDSILAVAGVRGIRLAERTSASTNDADEDVGLLNQVLGDQAMVYLPYLTESHPHFDMSHVETVLGKIPPHPPLDKAAWARLYHYAADQQFCSVY